MNRFSFGDQNINLLKVSMHSIRSDFLDILYSRGLYLVITKPSRIISTAATLIDNILVYINVLDNTVTSGLIINDITIYLHL